MQLRIEGSGIWLADKYVDFRKSINGLLPIMNEQPSVNSKCDIVVFYNRKKDKLKIIGWHRNGYVMIYKCLDKGKFKLHSESSLVSLTPEQLSWLLAGLDWLLMSSCKDNDFDSFY